VLLSAVWAHLPGALRAEAFANLARLLVPGGILALSLRHGPSPADRSTYPASAREVRALAAEQGLQAILHRHADSMQAGNRAAGVTWTWPALRSEGRPA